MADKFDHGIDLPPRTSPSLEDSLVTQGQDLASSQLGQLRIYSSWWEELKHRPFDRPEYVAFAGTPALVVYLSSDAVRSPSLLKQIFAEQRSWYWFVSAFLAGPFPVLRCSLMVPDNPADPFVLESPLNICNGDVQEFCKGFVLKEELDLVVGHEELPREEYAAVSLRAPGVAGLLRREYNMASHALSPDATTDDFVASVGLLEQQFPTALSGLEPSHAVRLGFAGSARNPFIQFEG